MAKSSEERLREVISYEYQYGTEKTLKHYGITEKTLRNYRGQYRSRYGTDGVVNYKGVKGGGKHAPNYLQYREGADGAEVQGSISTDETQRDKILEEFLDLHGIDRKKWEVVEFRISQWDVRSKQRDQDLKWEIVEGQQLMEGHAKRGPWEKKTNYSIQVKLRPRKNLPLIIGFETFIEKIAQCKTKSVPKFKKPSGVALELAPLDAHMGKLAWEEETGRRNYDLKQAVKDYLYCVEKILGWGSVFEPEKIYYVVGQDLMHVDNYFHTTAKGHHALDTDSRMPKIYESTFESVTKSVYLCRNIAPVEVIWIPGNHDLHASYFLCHALKQHFRGDPYVEVDVSAVKRKARLWGNLLVGWAHDISGRHASWANELAQAYPKLWGQSIFREWHHGHKHQKQEVKTHPVMTQGGVLCRQLTALSPIDAWHFDELFTDAVPGGEGFVWTRDVGVISNLVAWTETGFE